MKMQLVLSNPCWTPCHTMPKPAACSIRSSISWKQTLYRHWAIGHVSFEEGQPDELTSELWAASHAGYVTFASPSDPSGSVVTYAPVEEQTFTVHLPAGNYSMSVEVPGFETVTMEVTLEGETEINVPLIARD